MKKGSVLLGIIMLLTGLLTITLALSSVTLSSSIKIQKQYKKLSALAYAEAGVNKTLFKINQGTDSSWLTQARSSGGKLESDLTGGQYRIWIKDCNPVSVDCNFIESSGFIPTEAATQAEKTVRVKINGVQNVTNINFAYSAQSNANEVHMENGSKVKGSVYSNGAIEMSNGSNITGNATSSGTTPVSSAINFGSGSGATVNGVASAYTISSQISAGSKISGVYPAAQSQPIAEADLENTITLWENDAAAGYNSPGPVTLPSGTNQLGPAKINGDLNIEGDLQINGPIWVDGDVNIAGGVSVYLNPSFGNNSGVIIADHKSDRAAKGKITLGNGTKISGIQKDQPKTTSYTMLFSTRTSTPANWTSIFAIELASPNVLGGVYYAPYGSYHQKNNGQIRAVSANGLVLDQNATVDYDGNWGNSGISSGPGGKWTITEWLILD